MVTYIVEIVSILAGAVFVFLGLTKYGVWKGISISGGFMPVLCGGLVIIFSVLMIFSKIKRKGKAEKIPLAALIPVGAMLLILAFNALFGLIGACVAVSFLWLKIIEKYTWRRSIIVSVFLFIFIYGVFKLWLKVPFPMGLLENIL